MLKKLFRIIRTVMLMLFAGAAAAVIAAAVYIGANAAAWEKELDRDTLEKPDLTLFIYDKDDVLSQRLYASENRVPLNIAAIPQYVKDAFIAAEDVRFYSHPGIDIKRVFGALASDIKKGGFAEGASTITMQLIKNSSNESEKTVTRKIREAYLALRLESLYDKDEILEMYLQRIYFGAGAYGIEAAAYTYFGKRAAELDIAEAALLSGIIKAPSRYAPHINPENSVKRRNLIIGLMEKYGMISADEAACAAEEPLSLSMHEQGDYEYTYFTDEVLRQACTLLGKNIEELLTGGYRIYTTLDRAAQGKCAALFADGSLFPDGETEAAAVAVDVRTGGIRAVVGGRNREGRLVYDRAFSMQRQPGSAIKPVLVYAPAVELLGLGPADELTDEPFDADGYSPRNFSGEYLGRVSLRYAAAKSLNVPAVKLFEEIGPERAAAFAADAGISLEGENIGPALALGGFTNGVSPVELAGAYQPLANGGVYSAPYMIREIRDSAGRLLFMHEDKSSRIMSEETAFLVSDMLASAVDFGTAFALRRDGIKICAKTGTAGNAEGNSDIWVCAYTSEQALAVWMGHDSGRLMPDDCTGGGYPATLAARYFDGAERGYDRAAPSSLRRISIDRDALIQKHIALLAAVGTPADRLMDEYITEGSAVGVSGMWSIPAPPDDIKADFSRLGVTVSFIAEEGMLYRVYRQSEYMPPVMIGEVRGDGGYAYVHDVLAAPGQTYEYGITAVNPNLLEAGLPAESPASGTFSYTVPEY